MKLISLLFTLFVVLAMAKKLNASNMILDWNPSVSHNVAGYDVYYGTIDGKSLYKVNAGSATSVTISNLAAGTTYFFAATAYTSGGYESALSAAIVMSVPQSVSTPVTNPGGGATSSGGTGTVNPGRGGPPVSHRGGSSSPVSSGGTSRSGPSTGRGVVTTVGRAADAVSAAIETDPAKGVAADIAAAPGAEESLTTAMSLTMTKTADASLALMQFPMEQGHWYEVQATTDFQNWMSIWQSDVAISNGLAQFTDPDSKSLSSRFYRLVSH